MSQPTQPLQDLFLETLRKERTPVSVYLLSGIRLHGEIHSFDQFVVSIKEDSLQVIYKRAISTIVPMAKAQAAAVEPPRSTVSPPAKPPESGESQPRITLKSVQRRKLTRPS